MWIFLFISLTHKGFKRNFSWIRNKSYEKHFIMYSDSSQEKAIIYLTGMSAAWVSLQCCKNLKFAHLTFVTRYWIFLFLVCICFPGSAFMNKKGKKKLACCSHLSNKNVRAMNFHTTVKDVAFCESSFPSSAHCWAGLVLLLPQNKTNNNNQTKKVI